MNLFGLGGLFTPSVGNKGMALSGLSPVTGQAIGGMDLLPQNFDMNKLGYQSPISGLDAKPQVPFTGKSGWEQGLDMAGGITDIGTGLGGLYYGGKAINTMQDQQQLSEQAYNDAKARQDQEDEYLKGLNF